MLKAVRIRLTRQNACALRALREREPVGLEDLVNRALSDYLFSIRFEQTRERLSKPVAGRPSYAEDEILELAS
jgi:hypothetical protein